MKTSNFTLRFLLVSFFSLQTLMLCSQISAFGFDPIFGSPEPFYGEVYLYMPDNNSSITIREKSDLKFSFDRKLNSNLHDGITRVEPLDVTANNFRLSYSPVRHLYGTASLLMVGGGENLSSYDSKMTQGDIGIGGYYLKEFGNVFKKKNILNKTTAGMMQEKGLLVNALLGYGRGIIHHQLTWRSGLGEFRLNKIYGQVGFDYQARLWGFAGTARIGIINYGLTYLEGHAPAFLKAPMNLLADKITLTLVK